MGTQLARLIPALLLLCGSPARPQTSPAAGHWEGSIQVPDKELNIQLDLAQSEKGWSGTITIPQQNVKAFPLAVTIEANAVTAVMKGIPGEPTLQGTVSADRQTLSGNFSQGGGTIPFKVTRTGDAKIQPPVKSTPIDRQMEGAWEGTLNAPSGKVLHLLLKLANGSEGATGSMVSVDQGGVDIPIATITQQQSRIKLELPTIGGSYRGDIATDYSQISGTWSQGGGSLPLVFRRPAKKESK